MRTFSYLICLGTILNLNLTFAAEDPFKTLLDKAKTILREESTCQLFGDFAKSAGGLPATREEKPPADPTSGLDQPPEHRNQAFHQQLDRFAQSIQGVLGEIHSQLSDKESQTAFRQQLFGLAFQYDSAENEKVKSAIEEQMMKMFSIRYENAFIDLIAKGPFSPDLKRTLYVRLSELFADDPSWQAPLDRAMSTGGL